MPSLSNPSEIAREALRLLAARRMSPSPENYRALYYEIAGIADHVAEAFPEQDLKALPASLPRATASQQRLAKRFEQALGGRNWEEVQAGVAELAKEIGREQDLPWSELLGEFLRQWEGKQAGLTVARKREALERVLAGGSTNRELLFGRLQGLVKSWSLNAPVADEIPLVEPETLAALRAPP